MLSVISATLNSAHCAERFAVTHSSSPLIRSHVQREREERMFPLRQMYPTCRCICHQLIESMQTIHTAPYQICSFLLLYLLTFSPVYVNDTVSLKFHYLYLPLSLSRGGGSFHYELLSYCLQSLLLLMTHLKVR